MAALEKRNVFEYEDNEAIHEDESDFGLLEKARKIAVEEKADEFETLMDLAEQWAKSITDETDEKTRGRAFAFH